MDARRPCLFWACLPAWSLVASPGLCPTVGWGRACACSPRAPRGAPAACWPPPQAHRGACQGLGRQAMPPTLSRNKQRWLFLGRTDSWGPGWGQSPAGRVSSPRRSPRPASLWPGPVGAQVQRHHPPSSRHLPEASRGSRGPGCPGQENTHFSLSRDGGDSQLSPHPAHRIGGRVTESRGQALPRSRLPSAPGRCTWPHTWGAAAVGTHLPPLSLHVLNRLRLGKMLAQRAGGI